MALEVDLSHRKDSETVTHSYICALSVLLWADILFPLIIFLFLEDIAIIKEVEINDKICDAQVRVIDENGEQLGIMSAAMANKIADERNYDLVKISPNAVPPVCKIMDYGKFKFDAAKREKDARKTQKTVDIKEVWLSMTIDTHDLETKAKQAIKFLKGGDRVKVSIRMRGRQQAHSDIGVEVMKEFFELVRDNGDMDKKPLTEGKNIIMILVPKK